MDINNLEKIIEEIAKKIIDGEDYSAELDFLKSTINSLPLSEEERQTITAHYDALSNKGHVALVKGHQFFESGNFKEAVAQWTISANEGNCAGQFLLAGMYVNGQGVEKNLTKAVELFRLSAQNGQKDAILICNNAGIEF